MKRFIGFSAVGLMVLIGTSGNAQDRQVGKSETSYFSCYESHQKVDVDKAVKMYWASLHSANDGVVESALAHVAMMRICLRDREFPSLRDQIKFLAESGRTREIRYRAYLAGLVFDSPELFAVDRDALYADGDELFRAIGTRLQATLIGKRN